VNLQNNLGDDYCFELSALGSGPFNSTLSTNSVCIQDNESANITLRINGNREGSSTLSFIATYGNRTVTKTLGVNVTADTTTTPPSSNRVEIRVVSKTPNISQSGIIALENTGDDLADVTITLTGLPATTRATTITKSLWQGGETVELEVKNQDFNGVANATIRISSDLGNKNIPVSLNFTNPSQGSPTGLANLITDAAFILGGLIVVILAIVGLISIFQPK
ncbi:MAG TPA: hypothetical protein VJG83_04330, partial [archaeon]|nr:hypothetical protein [archaeon]